MNQSSNAPPKLADLVGEANAVALLKKVDEMNDVLFIKIGSLITEHDTVTRTALHDMLNGFGSWSDEATDQIAEILNADFSLKVACDMLNVAGLAQAGHPVPLSTYAAHALTHYENAIRDKYQNASASIKDFWGLLFKTKENRAAKQVG